MYRSPGKSGSGHHEQTEYYATGSGYSHVALTVDDLEGTVSKREEAGVEVALQPKTVIVEGHDYRIAFMVDPDGYRVELVERGTMKMGDLIQSATAQRKTGRLVPCSRRPWSLAGCSGSRRGDPSRSTSGYAALASLRRVSSASMPDSLSRFSPRILRLARSVSGG